MLCAAFVPAAVRAVAVPSFLPSGGRLAAGWAGAVLRPRQRVRPCAGFFVVGSLSRTRVSSLWAGNDFVPCVHPLPLFIRAASALRHFAAAFKLVPLLALGLLCTPSFAVQGNMLFSLWLQYCFRIAYVFFLLNSVKMCIFIDHLLTFPASMHILSSWA